MSFTITFTTASIVDTPLYNDPNGHQACLGPGTTAMVHVVAHTPGGTRHAFAVCGRTGRIYEQEHDTGRMATVHGLPDPEPFVAGKTAVVSLDPALLPLLGEGITGVTIGHDSQEVGSEWFLQDVTIETGLRYPTGSFVFKQWIVGSVQVSRGDTGPDVSPSPRVTGLVVEPQGTDLVVADGVSTVVIQATVTGLAGALAGLPVTFTTTAGTLSPMPATTITDARGIATVTLMAATMLGTATVTAVADDVRATASVRFIAGPPELIQLSSTPPPLYVGGFARLRRQIMRLPNQTPAIVRAVATCIVGDEGVRPSVFADCNDCCRRCRDPLECAHCSFWFMPCVCPPPDAD